MIENCPGPEEFTGIAIPDLIERESDVDIGKTNLPNLPKPLVNRIIEYIWGTP